MNTSIKRAGLVVGIALVASLAACQKNQTAAEAPAAMTATAAATSTVALTAPAAPEKASVDMQLTIAQQEALLSAHPWIWQKVVADPANTQYTPGQDLTDMAFTKQIIGSSTLSGDHRFLFTNRDGVKLASGYWELHYTDGKLQRTLKGAGADGSKINEIVDLVALTPETFAFRLEYPAGSGNWVRIYHMERTTFTATDDAENPFQAH